MRNSIALFFVLSASVAFAQPAAVKPVLPPVQSVTPPIINSTVKPALPPVQTATLSKAAGAVKPALK